MRAFSAVAVAAILSGCQGAVSSRSAFAPVVMEPAPGVTLANYKRLLPGMSYREVEAILGKPGVEGRVVSGFNFNETTYRWEADLSSSLEARFVNGQLAEQRQDGLK